MQISRWWLLLLVPVCSALRAAEWLPIEHQVAELTQSPRVTVVHFSALVVPELPRRARGRWLAEAVAANRDVDFVFITVRDEKPGANSRSSGSDRSRTSATCSIPTPRAGRRTR